MPSPGVPDGRGECLRVKPLGAKSEERALPLTASRLTSLWLPLRSLGSAHDSTNTGELLARRARIDPIHPHFYTNTRAMQLAGNVLEDYCACARASTQIQQDKSPPESGAQRCENTAARLTRATYWRDDHGCR